MSLADLAASAWALSALRVAADTELLVTMAKGVSDVPSLAAASQLQPTVTLRILEVLEANGFVSGTTGKGETRTFALTTEGADLAGRIDWLRADLAVTIGQANGFVLESRRSDLGGGWQHVDGEVIRAQSMLSELLNGSIGDKMVAAVPELARLARPGAKFLDVGAGGAGVSITFCKRYPSLHAVALEPLQAARFEARTKLRANGLADRIDVRSGRIEHIAEENTYDAAFVAAPFIPDGALAEGLGRLKLALVPGGVALMAAYRVPADARAAAASRLRWQLWGGGSRSAADVVRMVEAAGLVATEGPPLGTMIPIIARRK